jgi:hypothetical protein
MKRKKLEQKRKRKRKQKRKHKTKTETKTETTTKKIIEKQNKNTANTTQMDRKAITYVKWEREKLARFA